jgi:hypothetical protein
MKDMSSRKWQPLGQEALGSSQEQERNSKTVPTAKPLRREKDSSVYILTKFIL